MLPFPPAYPAPGVFLRLDRGIFAKIIFHVRQRLARRRNLGAAVGVSCGATLFGGHRVAGDTPSCVDRATGDCGGGWNISARRAMDSGGRNAGCNC